MADQADRTKEEDNSLSNQTNLNPSDNAALCEGVTRHSPIKTRRCKKHVRKVSTLMEPTPPTGVPRRSKSFFLDPLGGSTTTEATKGRGGKKSSARRTSGLLKKTSLQTETVTPWGVVLKPVLREEVQKKASVVNNEGFGLTGLTLEEIDPGNPVDRLDFQPKESPQTRKDNVKAKAKASLVQDTEVMA